MKKKILAMSFLTIVMCMSLIVGATFALFTSESSVNIAVNSGKVKVTAAIVETTTYSMDETTAVNGTFANGGTATVDGNSVVLDRMTPGDKFVLKVSITNESNVEYAQRISLNAAGEDTALQKQMLVGLSQADPDTAEAAEYTYYGNFVSAWSKENDAEQTRYISIELPEYAGNSVQGMSCTFALTVEAVQGNAAVSEEGAANLVYFADNQEALTAALSTMKDGDKIVLSGGEANWATANIAFADAKGITVCGYNVGTLTIDAPLGTVELYIAHTNKIDGVTVADNSLHIYGAVGELTVNSGRAVVEAGAAVQTVAVIPAANANTTVEFAANATVEAVTVDTSASGSSTNLTIGESVTIPELNISGDGEVALENSGTIGNTTVQDGATISGVATDEATLLGALKMDGVKVVLANDVTVDSATATVPAGVTVSIDLGGYTLTSNVNSGIINRGTITSLTNGNIVGGKNYGVVNYGHIATLNVDIQTSGHAIYVFEGGVIDEISGGNYIAHSETFGSSITGTVGLYISTGGVVKEISDGYFQGASVAFRSYDKNGIELISGGFFDSPYIDPNGRSFFDSTTIGELFYNYIPVKVTGGTFYNAGGKLDASIPEGYAIVQGDICEMTSYKKLVPYDASTDTPRHWEADPAGTVYYYYTVVEGTGVYVVADEDAAANGQALIEAVNGAADGSTVLLSADGKYELTQTLTITKNLTLLGNGATLTGNGYVNLIVVNGGVKATIDGLNFAVTNLAGKDKPQAITANGEVIVQNCQTTSGNIAHLVYVNSPATNVEIKNCESSRPLANIEGKSANCTLLLEGNTFKGVYDVCAITCTDKLTNVTFRNNTGSGFGTLSGSLVKSYNNMLTSIENVVFAGNSNIKFFHSPNESVQSVIDAAIASDELTGAVKDADGKYVQA